MTKNKELYRVDLLVNKNIVSYFEIQAESKEQAEERAQDMIKFKASKANGTSKNNS